MHEYQPRAKMIQLPNLKVSAALEIGNLSSDFGIFFQVIIKSTQHDVTFQNATFSETSNIEYCPECFRQR